MKRNKLISCVVALLMFVTMAVPAFAATENVSVYAGETAKVYFSYDGIYSLDGELTISDPNGIVDGWKFEISERDGMLGGNISDDYKKCFMFDTASSNVGYDVVLVATVKIKAGASAGQSATLSFAYHKGTDSTGMEVEKGTDTATVTVKTRPSDNTDTPTNPPADQPSNPSQPSEQPDQSGSSKPADSEKKIDYTELQRQIDIASGLQESDYTSESWNVLENALKNAKDHLKSKDQDAVDAAAKQLESAIAGLVPMDYTALEAALESVKGLGEAADLGDLLTRLVEAMINGRAQLEGNDQKAVDDAAAEINELVKLVEEALKKLEKTETVVEEVPVQVSPDGEFCNIPSHRIWPIIAIISLIGNVALIGVIASFVSKKKKNQKDNTPLVDYEIGDDE